LPIKHFEEKKKEEEEANEAEESSSSSEDSVRGSEKGSEITSEAARYRTSPRGSGLATGMEFQQPSESILQSESIMKSHIPEEDKKTFGGQNDN
jgi:hypothetical protein